MEALLNIVNDQNGTETLPKHGNQNINRQQFNIQISTEYKKYVETLSMIESKAAQTHKQITEESLRKSQSLQHQREQYHLQIEHKKNIKLAQIYNELSSWIKQMNHDNIKEMNHNDDDVATNVPRLTLTAKAVVRSPQNRDKTPNKYHPNYHYIKKRKGYPLRIYGPIIVDGYITHNVRHMVHSNSVSPLTINLCSTYLYNIDDEIHELAFVIYKTMRKIRKKCITKELFMKFIKHWLMLNNDELIMSYFNHLLTSKYFVTINVDNDDEDLYRVSIETDIGFKQYPQIKTQYK